MDLLSKGLAIGPIRAHRNGEILDFHVLLSDFELLPHFISWWKGKDGRIMQSVVPRTLRGITITNLVFCRVYQLAEEVHVRRRVRVLNTRLIMKGQRMGHHL